MKTYAIRKDDVDRRWHVIDADGRPLGRVSTQIATLLRGKHKPAFSPSLDVGDYVVVINASKIVATGNKLDAKMYYRHSGYPGSLRQETLRHLLERNPMKVIERAVRGMLPKTRLGRRQLSHLRVYAGPDHPHAGQVTESQRTARVSV